MRIFRRLLFINSLPLPQSFYTVLESNRSKNFPINVNFFQFHRYSQFRDEYSLEQILNSPTVTGPLTKLQCCPTSDGSAAAILATEEFVLRHNLQRNAVEILGMEMTTDLPSTFNEKSLMKVVRKRIENEFFQVRK